MLRRWPAAPFVLLALLVWGAGVARARLTGATTAEPAAPPWQHSFLELTGPQQRLYRELREGLDDAENRRAETQRWPDPAELAADQVPAFATSAWSLATQGPYVNYVGEAAGLRWLVLYIEPEPGLLRTPKRAAAARRRRAPHLARRHRSSRHRVDAVAHRAQATCGARFPSLRGLDPARRSLTCARSTRSALAGPAPQPQFQRAPLSRRHHRATARASEPPSVLSPARCTASRLKNT
jgi:hypothetical protein